MVVGILSVELRLPGNSSLKGKRKILVGLKVKLRNKFNISVAEVDHLDKWQRITLGITSVGRDGRSVNRIFSRVMEQIEKLPHTELIDYRMEII